MKVCPHNSIGRERKGQQKLISYLNFFKYYIQYAIQSQKRKNKQHVGVSFNGQASTIRCVEDHQYILSSYSST